MDRVFLDANVLFSASYDDDNHLLQLWNMSDVELVTSAFAVGETVRNVAIELHRVRLDQLLASARVVPEPLPSSALPPGITLPAKDAPILLSAMQAQATHLLTGDKRHFGQLFGQVIDGVLIQRPSSFLVSRGV